MIFKLFKIFASNIFSFKGFSDEGKKGPKTVIKNIFFGLLFAYFIGTFVVFYGVYMLNTYKQLNFSGETYLMPSVTMFMAMIVILFFGFTSVATNYYSGTGEEQFLSMPITPTQMFGAKFCVSLLVDGVMGILLFIIASVIYGYNEGMLTNPLFYVGMLISGISLSIISIALIYTLLILILTVFPVMRKRSILTGVASALIIVMAMGYSMFTSRASLSFSNSEALNSMPNPIAEIARNLYNWSFFRFVTGALQGKFISILFLIAIAVVIIFGLLPLLGKLYIKSLNGFSDVKSKKITKAQAQEVLKKDIHSASLFKAFFWRDVKTVWREPTFFANGPLMVFLFPVILIFSFCIGVVSAGGGNLGDMIADIQSSINKIEPEKLGEIKYYITFITAAFAIFIGSSCNIASSSFSREGKDMYVLKALPVQPVIIAKVKFWHSISYVFIADLILSLTLIVMSVILRFPISLQEMVIMIGLIVLVSSAVSLSIILVEMFIDTVHPKLNWENPIAAFKQNMNTMISVFFSFGVIAIFVLLGVFVLPKNYGGIIILAAVFGAISAPIGAKYFKYAERKIPLM